MKKQGRKVKKAISALKKTKKNASKVKVKAGSLLRKAKKKLNDIQKRSSKTLSQVQDKVYATEEEILEYVKENPIKSVSAVALVSLIAGFMARSKK